MKKILIIILFTCTSGVLAERSDRDNVVKIRRDQFTSAQKPNIEDLQLGKKWVCIENIPIAGYRKVTGPSEMFQFTEFGGIIRNELSSDDFIEYVLTDENLVSQATYYYLSFVRVTQGGDLVIEKAIHPQWQCGIESFESAISDTQWLAKAYIFCPKANAH